MGCSLAGSSVHGIFQARILEWIAVPSSRGSSQPRDRTRVSYVSCVGRQVLYPEHHPISSHHSYRFWNIFINPKRNSIYQPALLVPSSQPWKTTNLLSISVFACFGHFIVMDSYWRQPFVTDFFSLSKVFSWFTHIVMCISTSFLFVAK